MPPPNTPDELPFGVGYGNRNQYNQPNQGLTITSGQTTPASVPELAQEPAQEHDDAQSWQSTTPMPATSPLPRRPTSSRESTRLERQPEADTTLPVYFDENLAAVNLAAPAERRPIKLDYVNLQYVTEVDENLQCPICHMPLYRPVTTRCGHTFCSGCIKHALFISPRCPIDRLDLVFNRRSHVAPSPHVIQSLVDALQVKCPNRGCSHISARSLIEHHYDYTCPHSRIPCIDTHCDRDILRMDAEAEECLHRDVNCVHCGKTVMLADLDDHYDTDCADKTYRCEHCRETFARHKHDQHLKECKGREARCRFQKMGCKFIAKNLDLPEHEDACVYRAIFMHQKPLEEALKAMTIRLRSNEEELRSLRQAQHRAPDSQDTGDAYVVTASDNSNIRASPRRFGDFPSYGVPDPDFVLSMVESCESKVDNVEQYIREMDGRHSVMLLNELMPIKEQLTELRSNVGVMGMHVRWLMDHHRRKTTFQRVNASAVGAADMGSSGPSLASSASPSGAGYAGDNAGRTPSRRSHERERESQAPRL